MSNYISSSSYIVDNSSAGSCWYWKHRKTWLSNCSTSTIYQLLEQRWKKLYNSNQVGRIALYNNEIPINLERLIWHMYHNHSTYCIVDFRGKYQMEEEKGRPQFYNKLMKLHIHNITREDFGKYKCLVLYPAASEDIIVVIDITISWRVSWGCQPHRKIYPKHNTGFFRLVL